MITSMLIASIVLVVGYIGGYVIKNKTLPSSISAMIYDLEGGCRYPGRCYHKDEEGNFTMLYGDFTINGTKDPATYSLSEMSRQDYFDTLDAMDDIMEQIEGSSE